MPSHLFGIFLARRAAIGMRMTPPIIISKASDHRKFLNQSRNPKARTLVKLMNGSIISTMPTAFLGSPHSEHKRMHI